MADQGNLLLAGGVDQPHDVARQRIDIIGAHGLRLVAQVVPALIRDPDPVAGLGQGGDLPEPAAPEFRKTVEQDDDLTVCWTGLDDVEGDAVGWDGDVGKVLGVFHDTP